MFTDVGLREAEFVSQKESLAIFLEGEPPILAQRMNWHGEETQFHRLLLPGAVLCSVRITAL
jgi:hypothetical protein